MNATEKQQKSQKPFLAVTMMTVIAIATVFVAYAVVLSTLYGGNVTVVSVQGLVWYNETNSTSAAAWTSTLSNIGNGSAWYAKMNITSSGYTGAVTVTWTLQKDVSGTWTDQSATQVTGVTLTGSSGQTIYATSDGTQTLNKNWGASTTSVASYRVKVVIEKT
jgi:hypothetical protein